MQNPWDIRARASQGDTEPEAIFVQVGAALSAWEMLESSLAELFDALVSAPHNSRAGFVAFSAVTTSSARTEMLSAAIKQRKKEKSTIPDKLIEFIDIVSKFAARRNEIAHGRIYSIEGKEYFFGPNNISPHKWDKVRDGAAKYQYTSSEIEYYTSEFFNLRDTCVAYIDTIKKL